MATGSSVRGAELTSSWIPGDGNWNAVAKWSNGVPNNGVDTYSALINSPNNRVTLNLPVTISNLTLTAGEIYATNQALSVLGATTLGPGVSGSIYNSPQPAANFRARASGSASTSLDLGSLANFSGGVLSQGGFTAEMLNPGTDTGTATIRWQGAAITTIAAPVLISLTGGGASIRNSANNADALTGLQQINGELRLARRGITVTGPLTNDGLLSINSIQLIGGTTDTLNFQTAGAFTNNGTFTDNANSPNTTFQIGGAWTNAGTANLSFTNYEASPATLAASVGGNLVNSGTFSLRSGAGFGSGAQNVTFGVNGNLSNSGTFSLTGGLGALAMDFSGSLTGLVSGVLTGSWTLDASQAGSSVLLAVNNAPVTSIASGASVRILGSGAEFRDKTTSASVLANLSQVAGTLELSGQNLAVNGNFANTGTVIFGANAASGSKAFTISGNLANAGGGVLSAGNYQIGAAGAGVTALFSWNGTGITSIGANASVELDGAGALMQAGGVDALGGLNSVSGYLRMVGRTLAITGNFSNSGKTVNFVDRGVSLEDTNWALTGNLTNFGDFSVAGTAQNAQVAVSGTLSNAGTLTITGTGSSPSGYSAAVVAQGGLLQQLGTLLAAGNYELNAGSNGTATLAWQGADVRTIGVGVNVSLSGTGASIRDSGTNANALANLSVNNGNFTLANGLLTTNGALSNTASFTLDSYRAASSLTVGGGLANTGTLTVSGVESGVGVQTLLTVNGSFNNTGTIEVDGTSTASFRPAGHAVANIQGALAQQSGTTLAGGTYSLKATLNSGADQSSAVLAWQGAQVNTIGAGASVSLEGIGTSIRNLTNNADALAGLSAVAGNFESYSRDFTTAGNLDVSGKLYAGDGNFHVSGNLANSGVIEIEVGVFGGSRTFQVDGAFSNSGELYAVADGNYYAASAKVLSTSTLAQNSGDVLSAGTIGAYAYGTQGVAEVNWAGASINKIAAGASVQLQGAGAAIRNSGTQADALAGLAENAGFLSLGGRTQTFAGNFTNIGTLQLYGSGKVQMTSGMTLASTGRFEVGQKSALLAGNLSLGAGGTFEVFDDRDLSTDQLLLGSLQAGSILLAGNLTVTLYELKPSAVATYVILDGTTLAGAFSNVAFGQRVAVFNGNVDGAVLGTFQVNFDAANQNVTLSNFLAVPEPGLLGLLAVGGLALGVFRFRRR